MAASNARVRPFSVRRSPHVRSLHHVSFLIHPSAELLRAHRPASLRRVFVAGERCDPDTMTWLQSHLGPSVTVSDQWWQTELGAPAIAIPQVRTCIATMPCGT